jgi:hypothetical protein
MSALTEGLEDVEVEQEVERRERGVGQQWEWEKAKSEEKTWLQNCRPTGELVVTCDVAACHARSQQSSGRCHAMSQLVTR